MTEYQRAKSLAAKHGWILELEEWDEYSGCVRAGCPEGKLLDGDIHERVVPYDLGLEGPAGKRAAWTEVCEEIERGAQGALEDCDPGNESCRVAACFPKEVHNASSTIFRGAPSVSIRG